MSAAHRDDAGARLGMWLFLVTEFVLFGGLFLVYAYLRHQYPGDFHHAGARMDVGLGVANTVILLTSSLTVALAAAALQRGQGARAMAFLLATLALGCAFLGIKGFEWAAKFHHGLYPGSPTLAGLPVGEQLFLKLYFTLTGLHGLHVLAGLGVFAALLAFLTRGLARGRIEANRAIQLENGGLFWHLVDVVWIFLLPLFYLAA